MRMIRQTISLPFLRPAGSVADAQLTDGSLGAYTAPDVITAIGMQSAAKAMLEARNLSEEALIDGANATNPESGGVAFNGLPTVEFSREFRLGNNTFAAEPGHTGGSIESFVTKSGGSQFHGNACDFHISRTLNAASWAGKANSIAANPAFRKTPVHNNYYVAVIGGF